jgi:hypothetical protein
MAFALAFALAASPAFARGGKHKEGQFCSKKQSGKTITDKSGATLTCKADDKGKLRWTK